MPSVMWFRRDLRLGDNPALANAVADAEDAHVVPLFVLDRNLWGPAGQARRAHLVASLTDLGDRIGGLQVRRGDPVEEVVSVARAAEASRVHIAEDFGPYGRHRDEKVAAALAQHDIELVRSGTPYAVAPGSVLNGSGEPYQVFTPFSRAWKERGWPAPIDLATQPTWTRPLKSHDLYRVSSTGLRLPSAGEHAARQRWSAFLQTSLDGYGADRNRPDLDRTSRMSVHLKWGEIHPRTMLADLARLRGDDAVRFRTELAWREFYADVLWRRPETAREYLRPEFGRMEYDSPGERFDAWRTGRTGYPIVDAGMRQLRTEGWMHNRVRMIVASFLVKDLHIEWQHGARHFMTYLVDGDLASNQHGWQWTAGCGTDAAPYFRIFNPTTQGQRFDPDGDYVRRHVPELRGCDAETIHEPWKSRTRPSNYPSPIVEHAEERREALDRFEAIKQPPARA